MDKANLKKDLNKTYKVIAVNSVTQKKTVYNL